MTTGTETGKETLGFQAEVVQLLDLMIHSLYSNKEIFLRELISNGSDAVDKLRFEALSRDDLYEDDHDLMIHVSFDKDARTITVRDNGIGMSRQEVIEHIGTIAKSGTREFFQALTGDQRKDASLIGQFGVGFYSSFIVADRVTLITRRAGLPAAEGVRWESSGQGEYSIEPINQPARGTEVTLHLREDEDELLNSWRLRSIIGKYSDHISLPIMMPKESTEEGKEPGEEMVNRASALWARDKKEITEDEYTEFYKHVAHEFSEPLARVHAVMEGKYEYTLLLFIPSKAPFDLWNRDSRHGVKLYVRRVFIMDDAEAFLPTYLRFIKGVVDSNDLPLNVSRELLQQDPEVDAIKGGLTKRVLDLLAKLAKDEPEKYATFWKEFGTVLKEGVAQDHTHRDRLLPLLRFASTHNESVEPTTSLAEYLERMKPGQERIYYVIAESIPAARSSPYIEKLKERGLEVLLLAERVDEWVMGQLDKFQDKSFKDAARGDLELGTLESEEDKKQHDTEVKESSDLLKRVKEAVGERVEEVRASTRLKDSPAVLVLGEHDMGSNMRRIFAAAGQKVPDTKPTLEVNVHHPIVKYLESIADAQQFGELANLICDQAGLAEGGQLANPADYVQRLNRLLVRLAGLSGPTSSGSDAS